MTDIDFGAVEVTDGNEFVCPLIEGVEVRIGARDDGDLDVKVVTITEGVESIIYSDSHKRDFYSKQTKREIKNEVKESHPSGETIGAAFLELCQAFTDHHDRFQSALRPPAATTLLDETEKVEIYGGDTATFAVTMCHDGKTRRLDFTTKEIMGSNPAPLRDKYGAAFYEKVNLESEVWEDLADEWIAMAEEVAAEHMTEEEALANELMETLGRRLSVVPDPDGLANDELTAWYDEDNAKDNDDVTEAAGRDATVIWVRTGAIREFLKDAGKETTYFREFSPQLKGMGVTYTTSTQIRTEKGPKRCVAFNPTVEGLGITQAAVTDPNEVSPK